MKDSLVECLKNNYYGFYRMIAGYIPDHISVQNAGLVVNKYADVQETSENWVEHRHSMKNIMKKQFPLFNIMMKPTRWRMILLSHCLLRNSNNFFTLILRNYWRI